jgi:hypothetical protein
MMEGTSEALTAGSPQARGETVAVAETGAAGGRRSMLYQKPLIDKRFAVAVSATGQMR